MRSTNDLTGVVIDAAIEIHRALGPGLLESAYEELLAGELVRRGLKVQRQIIVPFTFKGQTIQFGFRIDLLVENRVIVELKAVERMPLVYGRQVLTYLRLMHLPVGLLINFGEYRLVNGIERVMNNAVPID